VQAENYIQIHTKFITNTFFSVIHRGIYLCIPIRKDSQIHTDTNGYIQIHTKVEQGSMLKITHRYLLIHSITHSTYRYYLVHTDMDAKGLIEIHTGT
jgi:hypothetical protein